MHSPLSDSALDQLFRSARTAHAFQPVPISDVQLQALYDLLKWGPTAFNGQPGRYVFVRSPEAKARLKDTLAPGNVAQTMAAPVTALVACDTHFYEHLPTQFPVYDAKPLFEDNAAMAQATAQRDATLQGAYLILAARSLGLDAGPMAGYNAQAVNDAFFPDGRHRVCFMVNLGVADSNGAAARGPRLAFGQVAQVL